MGHSSRSSLSPSMKSSKEGTVNNLNIGVLGSSHGVRNKRTCNTFMAVNVKHISRGHETH